MTVVEMIILAVTNIQMKSSKCKQTIGTVRLMQKDERCWALLQDAFSYTHVDYTTYSRPIAASNPSTTELIRFSVQLILISCKI